MMKNLKQRAILASGAVMSVVGLAATALCAKAADYSASTTAAISSAGESVIGMFFANLPIILGFVIAIILTLWGVRWILSQFHGGRRK